MKVVAVGAILGDGSVGITVGCSLEEARLAALSLFSDDELVLTPLDLIQAIHDALDLEMHPEIHEHLTNLGAKGPPLPCGECGKPSFTCDCMPF